MTPTFFKTPAAFRAWLEKHHATKKEVLVGFYRLSSGKPSITWKEAVDEALCFGWIDGIRRKHSDEAYSNRFTPRRPTSNWSAINIARVKELIHEGRMRPPGLAAFQKRKEHKSRVYNYEQKDEPVLEPALDRIFRANKKAWAFFCGQAPYYRRGETRWISSGKKEETRVRRLRQVMAACEQGRRRG